MPLVMNVDRWKALISKGFLRDIDDERTHPHKRALFRLLSAYFGPTTEKEKNLIEYTIRNNFGYTHRDSPYKYKNADEEEEEIPTHPNPVIDSSIKSIAAEAEKRFSQLTRG